MWIVKNSGGREMLLYVFRGREYSHAGRYSEEKAQSVAKDLRRMGANVVVVKKLGPLNHDVCVRWATKTTE